jgi:hypothetical protein
MKLTAVIVPVTASAIIVATTVVITAACRGGEENPIIEKRTRSRGRSAKDDKT